MKNISLAPPLDLVIGMVHLRLLDLLFQHLFVSMACIDSAQVSSAVESLLLNACYLSGAIGGAFLSDLIGPWRALAIGVFLYGLVGLLMTGLYSRLNNPEHVAGIVVIYGYFETPIVPLHSR